MSQTAKPQEASIQELVASLKRVIAAAERAKNPGSTPARQPDASGRAEPSGFPRADVMQALAVPPSAIAHLPLSPACGRPGDANSLGKRGDGVLELTAAMQVPPDDECAELLDAVRTACEDASAPVRPGETQGAHVEPATGDALSRPAALVTNQLQTAVTATLATFADTASRETGRSFDEVVHDLLRPMVKTWLDDNLPTIVERVVRTEIERVSRGRG